MPEGLGSSWPVAIAIVLLMAASGLVPALAQGASWQLKDDADLKAPGYHSDGVIVQDHQLQLGYQDGSRFQKAWSGAPGQKEYVDTTRFLSRTGLDTSSQDGVKLEKESWTRLQDSPTAGEEHVAVYDDTLQEMIVFGGQDSSGSIGSAWAYKPSTNSWSQLSDAPISRYWHSGSWDPVNGQLLVHGGRSDVGGIKFYNDTWAFDPDLNVWARKANETLKRYSQSSVWDPKDQRHLVFGGYLGGTISKNLAAYEPIGNTWEPKADGPVALYEQSAVWADSTGNMLIYGGLKSGGIASKDLYGYEPEANTWTVLAPGGSERSGQAAAWNPETKEMVVVGGHMGQTAYNDTWLYDPAANTWREGKPLPGSPRSGHTLVWSPDMNMVILYGGNDTMSSVKDVWAYSPYYAKSGQLVSSSFDMSGSAELTNIGWTDELSPSGCSGASVKLQLAGSLTQDDSSYTFGGPNGTSSYYTSGQGIDRGLVGMRYIRYKAFLSTTDVKCTPVLKEVRIGYRSYLSFGNWTSGPFDTGSNSLYFVSSNYKYDNPTGTDVKVFLRSAYSADMSGASSWEELQPMDSDFRTPPVRYLQLKAQLTSSDPGRTSTISSIVVNYNSIPHLVTSPVSPDAGGSQTEFVYKVTYYDGDGETPVTYKVYIDEVQHDMQADTYDYRAGANFSYKTKLVTGQHTYKFEFSDGHNSTMVPPVGDFKGPTVNDLPTALLKAPSGATKGKKATFDASGSSDPEGKLKQYKFDFGDGTDSGWVNTSKTTHVFGKTGTFKVKVTVKDIMGGQATSTETTVKVTEAKGFIPAPGPAALIVVIVVAFLFARPIKRGGRP